MTCSPADETSRSIDELADEFARRCRAGNCPSVSHYAECHPALAGEIRDLFPAIAAMEMASRKEEADRSDTRRLREIDNRLLDRLGDYRIVRQIGRGGMGVVYEAIQVSLGRTVALKVLTANVAHAPKQLARFQREAQAAAMLHHTNIVPIFGVGQDDGLHYYVMQYIEGVSLDRLIHGDHPPIESDDAQRGVTNRPASPLGWRNTAVYGLQIAQAVDYAHRQGVLHRDIKPANLLVDTHDTVWVTDFGLAKVFGDDQLTQSGDVFGTLRYMAPEQFAGESTAASDVYSIGVTLYEMATGQIAFANSDPQQLIRHITHQGIPRPRQIMRHLPQDLETIILKAAAFDPRHRYATAADLADDLRRLLDGEPIAARRATVARRLWRWSCRNPALAALSGISLLLLLAVAVVASIGLVRVETARQHAIELARRAEQRSAELRVATERAQRESNRARSESQRAEDNLQLAMRAFEDVIERVSGRGLPESLELDLEQEERELPPRLFTADDAELLQSLLVFYEEFARHNHGDESVQWETAKAHHRIGDIRQHLGQLDLAIEAYDRALAIYQRAARPDAANLETLLATVTVLNQRGVTHMRAGEVRESIESHLEARDLLLSQGVEVAHTNTVRLALVETYNHLGAIWARADVTGIPVFRRAPGPRRPALSGQSGLSTLDWMEENHQATLELLGILMAEDPSNVDYRLALARCYRNGLPLVWHGGSVEEAAGRLAAAVSILEQLVEDFPDTPRYSFELADILSIDAPQLRDTAFGQASWQRLEQAEQIARRLNNAYPNQPEYQTLYANALYRLGLIIDRQGQVELAIRHLTESVKHYQQLLERFPHLPAYVASLGRVSVDLSELQRSAQRWDDAQETLEDAILRLIATYDPDADLRPARRALAMLQLNLLILTRQ